MIENRSVLELTLLGPPSITLDGKPIAKPIVGKTLLLLCYLALEADRPHSRERLACLLWGDMPEAQSKANLRRTLYKIQKAIPDYLVITRSTVAFDATQPHYIDVAAFCDALRQQEADAAALEKAVGLYRSEFLDGLYADEAAELEDWLSQKREYVHLLYFSALDRLAGH